MDSNSKTDRAFVTPWPGDGEPGEFDILRKLRADGLIADAWSNAPGDMYGTHTHSYHKVIYCVSGSITFGLPDTGESIAIVPGDRLDVPAGVRHNAKVGDKGVYCLEAHL
ncbi:MAG TPA: cupin domain-containing protein [Chloroflexia bacterium]|nr:cupin domain-containing protein [Chloroflexia bacterium]